LGKFGSRCYLKYSICPCKNKGICTPNYEFINQHDRALCVCPDGFSGPTCETLDTAIIISFKSGMVIPSAILVHFIQVFETLRPHVRSTAFKKVALDQDTVTIYRTKPFQMIFIEIEPKTYYLSLIQQKYIPSTAIPSTLSQSKRCLPLIELFNATFVSWHLIRRMKYYHIPCRERRNLECFYDENHICICNHLEQANCFIFDHNMTYNCKGQSLCENQGRCFQDDPNCPTSSICVCDECSYGSQCQFSTKDFAISLDIILGYQIRPHISFNQQRSAIKITTAIVTLMLICGLVSSIASIMTFQTKKVCEVGCGYYLLVSSYIATFAIIMFALKFSLLITSQMGLITNRIYLLFNCILIEFIIKILVNISDWLTACVGIERAIVASQDNTFNKTKTKQIAKWIIILICILTVTTNIQDPIYRRLIDDDQENRTWCIVKFTSSVKNFNSVILFFHFILPFILNIISAFIIIFKVARHRSTAQKQLSYQRHLRQQFSQFKHLLISPIVLIILALPRLIISFLSGCMKSPRDPWLFLVGYFISFVPPILIFIVFVIPSKIYKNELKETIKQIKRYIRRH